MVLPDEWWNTLLATQNLILQRQNNRLKNTVIEEKKRRKRGKPLTLDFPTKQDGSSIFYSLRKIRQACEC